MDTIVACETCGLVQRLEDPNAIPVKEGTIFPLHDKPEKEWLSWRRKIPIPPPS